MTAAEWQLTPQRVAVHLPTGTAVLSDLHLGYAEARQRQGDAIPSPSVASQLMPLVEVIQAFDIAQLVIAGDLFETKPPKAVLDQWKEATEKLPLESLIIVPGNHDKGIRKTDLPVQESVQVGQWQIVHGDRQPPVGPIVQGHLHPCLRLSRTAVPCYLLADSHLILPAYTTDASGMNILSKRKWDGYCCHAIQNGQILSLGPVKQLKAKLQSTH